ncbi:hypothetical protein PRIPAC_77695, partial [Pristionchus pacificus]
FSCSMVADVEAARLVREEVQRDLADLNRITASVAASDKERIQMKAMGETSSLKDNQLTRDQRSGTIESGCSDDPCDASSPHPVESRFALFFQVVIPFTIAGFGMVLAGVVLDYVQHWELFEQVPEVFIIVPALLGLKGNLEMTLASRLSTLANLGELETSQQRCTAISANMALVQVQATVVAVLASAFAMLLDWIPTGKFDLSHGALLCASALATACTASFLLSLLMSAVVIGSREAGINPDNVATPIAASLGDLTTLAVLSLFGSLFLHAHQNAWLLVCIIGLFVVLVPVWWRIALWHPRAEQKCFFVVPRAGVVAVRAVASKGRAGAPTRLAARHLLHAHLVRRRIHPEEGNRAVPDHRQLPAGHQWRGRQSRGGAGESTVDCVSSDGSTGRASQRLEGAPLCQLHEDILQQGLGLSLSPCSPLPRRARSHVLQLAN